MRPFAQQTSLELRNGVPHVHGHGAGRAREIGAAERLQWLALHQFTSSSDGLNIHQAVCPLERVEVPGVTAIGRILTDYPLTPREMIMPEEHSIHIHDSCTNPRLGPLNVSATGGSV